MVEPLIEIIRTLRSPTGCPWDREQTPTSVKKYLIEELYELIDAIEGGEAKDVKEELGDLLFMILFLGHMYEETDPGFIEEAIKWAGDKMIRRHPHIFGDIEVESTEEVKANWQTIKEKEAKAKGKRPTILGDIPRALPALQRAYRLGERASRVGFDWGGPDEVLEKCDEEMSELKEALKGKNAPSIEAELGDVLFTLANLARHLSINPEDALFKATQRFERRFKRMEGVLKERGVDIFDADLKTMDGVWEEVKEDSESIP